MLLAFIFLIFTTSDSEAGCNGSCSYIEEGDWLVTEDTHMYDQILNVNDITVSEGVEFKLENVNATITGQVTLNSDTIWINSNINHLKTRNETNITINEKLEIISSNITINATGNAYDTTYVQGFFVPETGYLVIRDLDSNPSTIGDASTIRSMAFNSSDFPNSGIEIGTKENSRGVSIRNSIIYHLTMYNYGNNLHIHNNTFVNCGTIQYRGNNLNYENNTNKDTLGFALDYYGDGGVIQNNLVYNGTQGFYVDGANDSIFRNNYVENISGYGLAYLNYQNLEIYNNSFVNVATSLQGWNATNVTFFDNIINGSKSYYGVWVSGNNITVHRNNFTNCERYCILVTSVGLSKQENITITNNIFSNVTISSVQISSGLVATSNITVTDNLMESGFAGVRTWGWGNYDQVPSNVKIKNNTILNVTYGIELKSMGPYGATLKGGEDYTIESNHIEGAEVGIKLESRLSLYDNIKINSNNIWTNESGIYCQESREGIITNNFISSNGKGITLSGCESYEVENNIITVGIDGIELYKAEANIEYNNITSNCTSDDCAKVSFTKVGNYGIRVYEESEANLRHNRIEYFSNGVSLEESEIGNLYNNYINFTETGLLIYLSEINIQFNNINNSQEAVNSIDSTVNLENLYIHSFDIGIDSVNSTYYITNLHMTEGRLCLTFIDTAYIIDNFENVNCNEANLYEKYYFNVFIQTNEGIAAPQHNYNFSSSAQSSVISSFTNDNGLSDYHLVIAKKIDNSGLTINFNPYTISYVHNGIATTFTESITTNRTIHAYLDTTPPTTILNCGEEIINQENIVLQFEKISEKNDLLNYDVYVLVNDGVNFAEWEYVGTYNESTINFLGDDNTKYRFKSISRDIFGNRETKLTYDCELSVDLKVPSSFFNGINANYYFTSNPNILLDWDTSDDDVVSYNIEIFYTNFTTPYLDTDTVVWSKISNLFYYENGNILYVMENMGHYSFRLTSTDEADNEEVKESFDFTINFDPESDRLSFGDIPSRWGSESLTIKPSNSALNLEFDLFLAMEAVDERNPYFTWYEHPHQAGVENIVLSGLLDRTKYYLYAESIDLAGNIENPLSTSQVFNSNGNYDQKYVLNYIPLIMENYPFEVSVDSDLDGVFDTYLQNGEDLNFLDSNEYFIDEINSTIIFGGLVNGGYVPPEGNTNVRINYSGVHAIFEVYTGNPDSAENLEIMPTNVTHIVFEYDIPLDASKCYVQRTTNISKGWFNQEVLSPCDSGIYQYEHKDPDTTKTYYYRILIEDEFGHESISENRSIDMKDVVKLYSSTSDSDSSLLGMDSIIPITALVGVIMLGFGGILLYRTKTNGTLDENVSIIESKPVAKYKVEELYLIYKDGRLIRNISAVEIKTDSDIMSGMLTAINDFVQDSFNTEGDLGSIDYGNNKIILQRENHSYLAAVVYGEVDNYFKGKMINAVRKIEEENSTIKNWNGDSSSITNVQKNLEPIIAETESATREMVDNYFTEKEIAMTTTYNRDNDNTNIKINLSNYSSTNITDCKIIPEYNDSLLGLNGIVPTVPYYFDMNTFEIGDIKSYNEVQFTLKMKNKSNDLTTIELKLEYSHKGRISSTTSIVEVT